MVIGKDTRLSGYMMETALVAGFTSVGMDVIMTGPLPTPAVALLTREMRADLGVMISASHNLFADNGIKLFGPDGFKLSDADEAAIEAAMRAQNAAALVIPAHTLKGESRQFGAEPLAALAQTIEEIARDCVETHETPEQALEPVAQLRPLFEQTLALLEREANPLMERRPAAGFGRRAV